MEPLKTCSRSASLTPDQVQKIKDIQARSAKAAADAQETVKKAMDELNKTLASKDQAVRDAALKKYSAALKPTWDAYTKGQTEVAAVLTHDQADKWKEYAVLKSIKQWYAGVKFTEDQWDKVMDTYEKLAKDPNLAFWDLSMKLKTKVDELLTPPQKAQRLLAGRYHDMNAACHFTDDQMLKIVKVEDQRAQAVADLQQKNSTTLNELTAAAQAAYASNDKDVLATVQKGYADMNKGYTDLNAKLDDQVQSLLTDTQKQAWKDLAAKNPYWQWNVSGGGVNIVPAQPATPRK